MLERTSAQGAALAEELRNVLRQAEKLVVALGEDKEEALVELRGRLSVALDAAKERLADFEQKYARENPWTVVAVSAAIGLVLGAWLASPGSADET